MKNRKAPEPLPFEDPDLWALPPRLDPIEGRPRRERLDVIWTQTWIEHRAVARARYELLVRLDRVDLHDLDLRGPLPPARQGHCILFVSEPANGATAFLATFADDARSHHGFRTLTVRMPVNCDVCELFRRVHEALHPCVQPKHPNYLYPMLSQHELREMGVGAVIVDDGGHLLALPPDRRATLIRQLRDFGPRAGVPLILVVPPTLATEMLGLRDAESSTPMSMLDRIITEVQLPFLPVAFPRFRMDRRFIALLDTWERSLPLQRASQLASREIALHLYTLCDGIHGPLASVLRRSAEAAILDGSERISLGLLDELGFEPAPSFRRFRF